jgi:hypothetical protein
MAVTPEAMTEEKLVLLTYGRQNLQSCLGTCTQGNAYHTIMKLSVKWMSGVLRSLLFQMACPLVLIFTT